MAHVAVYAGLMERVYSFWQDIPFTEQHIQQLHQILLQHSEKDAWHRGHYKKTSNRVAAFDERGAQIGIAFMPVPFPPDPSIARSPSLQRRFDDALVALGRIDALEAAGLEIVATDRIALGASPRAPARGREDTACAIRHVLNASPVELSIGIEEP